MGKSNRPQFDADTEAHLEGIRVQAYRVLWGQLSQIAIPLSANYFPSEQRDRHSAPPAKTPKAVLVYLRSYARTLYFAEGTLYQQQPGIEAMLQGLKRRIVAMMMEVVAGVEKSVRDRGVSIANHGLTEHEMRKAASDEVQTLIRARLNPPEMVDRPPLPPEVQRQMHTHPLRTLSREDDLRRSGVDLESTSPLLQEVVALALGSAKTSLPTPKEGQNFCEELDRLLREARTTPEGIAEKIDVDPTTVYRHKSGKFSPNRTTVGKYERALSGILGYEVKLPMPVKRHKETKRQ